MKNTYSNEVRPGPKRLVPLLLAGIALALVPSNAVAGPHKNSHSVQLAQGDRFGDWVVKYTGYGTCSVVKRNGSLQFEMQPMTSVGSKPTHAALITGPYRKGHVDFRVGLKTVRQLRTGAAPNQHEVAWAVWNYKDDQHFYYIALKPNGWEFGKVDGVQVFLKTDGGSFPVGKTYHVHVIQDGTTVNAWVDGEQIITNYSDDLRPFQSGHVALYCEDSQTTFSDLSLD